MTYDKCKLLSPVGSMDVLKAAIFSGADCVYLSGTKYGARGYAENFDYDNIKEAVNVCHEHNVEVFVTVNTCILESEMLDVVDYVFYLYNIGVDGIIVQDIGLASVISELMPELSLHASTQMTIYDYSFVKWLCENNFSSANMSREVSIDRIGEIISKLRRFGHDINIEVFAHGALCYCYSGQCLMSSFLGGRSGNRGLCAQPCRVRYTLKDYYNTPLKEDDYLLSTKDLCTYYNVDKFLKAGVNCLKIEGRMKSSEYVASTTYAYKNAICNNTSDEDYLLLNLAFNRGFTDGYILNRNPGEVVSRTRAGNQGYPIGKVISVRDKEIVIKFINRSFPTKIVNGDGLKFEYDDESCGMYVSKIISQNKNKITIKVEKGINIKKDSMVYITYSKYLKDRTKAIINEENIHKTEVDLELSVNDKSRIELKASCENLEKIVHYTSKEKLEEAKNKPITITNLNKQLRKTGNTTYKIRNIDIKNFPDNKFIAISSINNIRRELIKKIDNTIKEQQIPDKESRNRTKEKIKELKIRHYQKNSNQMEESWNIYINRIEQAELIKKYPYIKTVYYDGSFNSNTMEDYITNITEDLLTLHETIPEKEIVWILPQILTDDQLPHIGEIIVKLKYQNMNIKIQSDNIGIAKNLDVEKYGSNLNVYNNYTIKKLSENPGFERLQVSNEISLEDIRELNNSCCELEYTVFGYVQLMITKDNYDDLIEEELTNTYYLLDKRNNRYIIKKDSNKNSHIYDYRILNQEKHINQLRQTDITSFTIDCRFFSNQDTERIMEHFQKIKENESSNLKISTDSIFYDGNLEKGVYK